MTNDNGTTLAGFSIMCLMLSGLTSVAFGFGAAFSARDFVGCGILFIAAAISFGFLSHTLFNK